MIDGDAEYNGGAITVVDMIGGVAVYIPGASTCGNIGPDGEEENAMNAGAEVDGDAGTEVDMAVGRLPGWSDAVSNTWRS